MVQEIKLLRSVSFDRNIVQFCGACLQPNDTMMILEYMAVCTQLLYTSLASYMPFLFDLIAPKRREALLHMWQDPCNRLRAWCLS